MMNIWYQIRRLRLPDYASLVAYAFRRAVTYRPLQTFPQHAVQLFPITFAGVAIQNGCLHRLHPHFGIRENPGAPASSVNYQRRILRLGH